MAFKHNIRVEENGRVVTKNVRTTPLGAIKLFCIECMGWQKHLVRDCTAPGCPLFPYRLGKNPGIERVMSEEEKNKVRDRLRLARETSQTNRKTG